MHDAPQVQWVTTTRSCFIDKARDRCDGMYACCTARFVRTLTLERSSLICQWLTPTAATTDGQTTDRRTDGRTHKTRYAATTDDSSARSMTGTLLCSRSTRQNWSWWRHVVSIAKLATSTSCQYYYNYYYYYNVQLQLQYQLSISCRDFGTSPLTSVVPLNVQVFESGLENCFEKIIN